MIRFRRHFIIPAALLVLGAGCQTSPSPGQTAVGGCETFYDVQTALAHANTACRLDVSGKGLAGSLPAEIRQLTRLQELNASRNKMTGLPAEIGQLKDLRILDVSDNQLTGLPLELGNLTQLRTLDVSGNPYSVQDLNAIASRLSQTDIRK